MAKTLWFGKYKGRTVAEVLEGDPEYLQWLCSQGEFRERRAIYRDIIDCIEGWVDAPERDAPAREMMQGRFQDVDFCRRFLQASGHEAILLHKLETRHAKALGEIADRLASLKEATDKAKNYIDDPGHRAWAQANGIFLDPVDREQQIAAFEQMTMELHTLRKRIPNQIKAPKQKISCLFAQHGFDVVMRASLRYPWESELRKQYLGSRDGGVKNTVAIRIRWTVGNDYPVTLRRIGEDRNVPWGRSSPIADHVVLLVGRFNGENAVKEQFVGEAAAADIKVVFAADLEAHQGSQA
jgi:hypothetical protein